ncbi:MAG: tRNA dihydrouridine synthase DusB [Candidatus Cloacimonadales bacterium]
MDKQQKISELSKNKLWLAPLAGVTDRAFRTICKEKGADVLVSEMVSADGLIYAVAKSLEYAKFSELERPFGIQIFGDDPEIMARAAEIVLQEKPDFIDLNMGCPVKKVVKRGAGSALMQTPQLAAEIVKAVKAVLQATEIPLSVKFRAGWDLQSINYLQYGLLMAEAGADLLILHPRTRSQMFSGSSNWDFLRQLKAATALPVIGNGDIWKAADARKMLVETGCDGVMIGRGALGNPWIFQEIKQDKATGKVQPISFQEKFATISRHLQLAVQFKGEARAIPEMRTQLSSYTKGLRGGAAARAAINQSSDIEKILHILEQLFEEN